MARMALRLYRPFEAEENDPMMIEAHDEAVQQPLRYDEAVHQPLRYDEAVVIVAQQPR